MGSFLLPNARTVGGDRRAQRQSESDSISRFGVSAVKAPTKLAMEELKRASSDSKESDRRMQDKHRANAAQATASWIALTILSLSAMISCDVNTALEHVSQAS